MIERQTREKMQRSSYLLPDPGGEVVRTLLKDISQREEEEQELRRRLFVMRGQFGEEKSRLNTALELIDDLEHMARTYAPPPDRRTDRDSKLLERASNFVNSRGFRV